MYRAYQIYLVLIKVDLFFFVGFSIQFIYLTLTNSSDPEYWLTIIVTPLTPLMLYIAFYAVRHESRNWMTTFIVAMLCGVVYFVFKVVRMYYGNNTDKYKDVKKFLTLFGKGKKKKKKKKTMRLRMKRHFFFTTVFLVIVRWSSLLSSLYFDYISHPVLNHYLADDCQRRCVLSQLWKGIETTHSPRRARNIRVNPNRTRTGDRLKSFLFWIPPNSLY